MKLIDADKFLTYLIYSKHIDSLTCGDVKKAVEMCEVDVLDKIRVEIQTEYDGILWHYNDYDDGWSDALKWVLEVIDKYIDRGE